MSYDVRLTIDTGNGLVKLVEHDTTTTYNAQEYFVSVLGKDGLWSLDSQNAGESLNRIAYAHDQLMLLDDDNDAINQAVRCLAWLNTNCRLHPLCTIEVY